MNLDTIPIHALTHFADKLPEDALPHLGNLANICLLLPRRSRRRFFRGLKAIFGYMPGGHKRGMRILLDIRLLEYEMRLDAVRDANCLRRKVTFGERETVYRFFEALRRARLLQTYYDFLDLHEDEGEKIGESIIVGTAFRPEGFVSRLADNCFSPKPPTDAGHNRERLPSYDPVARELRVGDVVMRRYRKFNYHERILQAFEDAGWEKYRVTIPDFFHPYPDRLRDTIDQLNKPQKNRLMLIHFRLNGTYIEWEWRERSQ